MNQSRKRTHLEYIALTPPLGAYAARRILSAPLPGSDLYFGKTKVSTDVVDAVVKKQGGVATLFVKSGDQYVRVATTVKKDDGTSAVGTPLDANSPAIAKLNNGEAYYGDATIFGKAYDAGYELIPLCWVPIRVPSPSPPQPHPWPLAVHGLNAGQFEGFADGCKRFWVASGPLLQGEQLVQWQSS